MKRQSGFTLIELIIVIVILGILAVTVAPQFFNFGSDARASTVRGLEGSLRAASELVHARAQIGQVGEDGGEGTGYVRVREGSAPVQLESETLYAAASDTGILRALNLDISNTADGSDWVWVTVGDSIAIRPASESGDAECQVLYTPAGTGGDAATDAPSQRPQITSVTTGC